MFLSVVSVICPLRCAVTNVSSSVGLHKGVRYEHRCSSSLFVVVYLSWLDHTCIRRCTEQGKLLFVYSADVFFNRILDFNVKKINVLKRTKQRRAVSRANASVG